jgi:hypothetical protein
MLFTFGTFIGFIGLYVAIFYISYFGQASGITDASLSFYLVPILNAGSVFGRTLPNWLSDKTGPFNLIMPGAIMCGILLLCMLSVHTVGGIVVITLLFGFFSGMLSNQFSSCLLVLTQDRHLYRSSSRLLRCTYEGQIQGRHQDWHGLCHARSGCFPWRSWSRRYPGRKCSRLRLAWGLDFWRCRVLSFCLHICPSSSNEGGLED